MYFPLAQVFPPANVRRLATEIPYPEQFSSPLKALFAVQFHETETEARLCAAMTGNANDDPTAWLKRFAHLYSTTPEDALPWWRLPPMPLAGRAFGYDAMARLFARDLTGVP